MPEDLYTGPTVLAPGAPDSPDRLARWLIWPLLGLLFVVVIVFYVIFSPLQVVGESMEPSLRNGDRALRTKSYDEPRRGDVVVIDTRSPNEGDDVVKRVVGLPGDVVEIRDDIALVNGTVEDITSRTLERGSGTYRPPITVPEGSVYVLGDNRPVSLDSRFIGVLPLAKVRGRVTFVFLPPNRFGPTE